MVDSASNNIHRIVHLQYESNPLIFPDYAALGNNDKWISIQNYQDENWDNLIQLWKYSNLHIIHVINHIDTDKLENIWISALNEEISLKKMTEGYLPHLKLHIGEIEELLNEYIVCKLFYNFQMRHIHLIIYTIISILAFTGRGLCSK